MSVYLITGGTGTLGTALTHHLLKAGHKVRVLARNEHGHERLQSSIEPNHRSQLSSCIGSVEDRSRVTRACGGVDYVIHAAAQKVIPLCEYSPAEAVGTNVGGTLSVLNAALDCGVKRAVLVSTDKASSPATLYGGTKFVAERLWLNANRYSAGKEPHFVAVRYGNVWGSQGSVLHAWTKQAQYGHIEITDPQCTRFHILLSQACTFVLDALRDASPGELWVPRLPSYRLGDLAHAFRLVYGIAKQPVPTGLRLSEKLHESMISTDEYPSMKSEEENHYVLEPGVIHRRGRWEPDGKLWEYSSGSNQQKLGVEALREEVKAWASL